MKSTNPQKPLPHLDFLDVARGIAILLVVAFHLELRPKIIWGGGWLPDFSGESLSSLFLLPLSFGWLGVAVFFGVSGFCIHLSYQRLPSKSWKTFFLRRFFRIYPAYFAALCFFAFILTSLPWDAWTKKHWLNFGIHVLLVHNISSRSLMAINSSFWSIAVEVQLYLIYPLLLGLKRKLEWNKTLLILGGIEGALRIMELAGFPCWLCFSPFKYWLSWSAGAKLADDYLENRPLFLRHWPVWIFPLMTAISLLIRPLSTFSFMLAALATVRAIGWCLEQQNNAPPSRITSHVAALGGFSYSLYLIHQPFLIYVGPWLKTIWPVEATYPMVDRLCNLAILLGIFFAAWLFYRWVERPSVALGKRLTQSGRPKADRSLAQITDESPS